MKKVITFLTAFILAFVASAQEATIKVGAKHFNEGYILSEMLALILEDAGYKVERRFNLGGTAVSFEALRNGAIDVYPEYTGTIAREILRVSGDLSIDTIDVMLKRRFRLGISPSYGFENKYALLMDSAKAASLGIQIISDLQNHPTLQAGLSYEFMKREDGWENLKMKYNLLIKPQSLEHGLAYEALRSGKIDLTDAYSTDGEIRKYDLLLLKDDQDFFPDYHAVSFYGATLPPKARSTIEKLNDAISENEMQWLNARALFEKEDHHLIAHNFLVKKKLIHPASNVSGSANQDLLTKTAEHLFLTLIALLASMAVALPLGVFIYYKPRFANTILYATGVLQTIPSIALLALMIPFFGIGKLPAIIALFLYALLPILRNTITGLRNVEASYKNVASAMGLTAWQRLRIIEIPLAKPTILAGIRTAAVINVGTATLAAFIGAGGLGDFIVTGLALNNTELILRGAIPSALLAIAVELTFEWVERLVVLKHLRQ